MADETKQDNLESENQGDGGETVDNKTTANETDAEKIARLEAEKAKSDKIAEDQRKRAEIAEAKAAEANKGKGDDKPAETKTNQPNTQEFLTRDEGVLIARGFSDEAIAQAKLIAKGADVPLLEAIDNPLFKAFQEKEEEEKKKAAAKLGASSGSGVTPDKDVPLDPAEHKKFWQEQMGK